MCYSYSCWAREGLAAKEQVSKAGKLLKAFLTSRIQIHSDRIPYSIENLTLKKLINACHVVYIRVQERFPPVPKKEGENIITNLINNVSSDALSVLWQQDWTGRTGIWSNAFLSRCIAELNTDNRKSHKIPVGNLPYVMAGSKHGRLPVGSRKIFYQAAWAHMRRKRLILWEIRASGLIRIIIWSYLYCQGSSRYNTFTNKDSLVIIRTRKWIKLKL